VLAEAAPEESNTSVDPAFICSAVLFDAPPYVQVKFPRRVRVIPILTTTTPLVPTEIAATPLLAGLEPTVQFWSTVSV
jgi:hypothetical protein